MSSDRDRDKYYAIMDWYDAERRNKAGDLVCVIKKKLADDNSNAERIALLQAIGWELRDRGEFAGAADALLEWAALEPWSPCR
jgi:hypothetical protein